MLDDHVVSEKWLSLFALNALLSEQHFKIAEVVLICVYITSFTLWLHNITLSLQLDYAAV